MTKGRLLLLAMVAGAHAFIIMLFGYTLRPISDNGRERYSVWLIAEEPDETPTSVQSKLPLNTKATDLNAAPEQGVASRLRNDISPPASNAKPVDWRAAGSDAVARTMERSSRAKSQRPLRSDPVTIERPSTSSEGGLFTAPLYRNGDVQRFDDAELNTWINSECFATNRHDGPLPGPANQVNVVCKGNVGKRKADGTLFEHLVPSYLRDPSQQ
jgi:hypothetical protein